MRTIISILIIGAVLWFSITNAGVIDVQMFLWNINASLALVVGVTFFLGFLLGVLYLTPGFLRHRKMARIRKNALDKIQVERDESLERSKVLEEQVHQLAPNKNKE